MRLAGVDGDVDVEAQVAGVEVGVEGLGEQAVGGLGVGREGLEVEREAAIAGVGGEELIDLVNEVGAGRGAEEELFDVGLEDAFGGAVVVDHGEDFGIFAGGLDGVEDLVFAIDAVDAGGVDDGEGGVVGGEGGEGAVGLEDVEPLGEEEIDLLDVLLEGGVAGGVEVGVEGGAQAFALVEGDVGGLEVGLAMGGAVELFAGPEFGGGRVGERAVTLGGGAEVEALHGLHADEADDEDDADEGAEESEHVEYSPQALPAFALRIVEDLFAHR